MADVLQFYIDNSGARNPDKKPGKRPEHGYDWFALGGILLKEEDKSEARERHGAFCQRWNITYPLHSSEIRGRTLNFLWLEDALPTRSSVATLRSWDTRSFRFCDSQMLIPKA